MTFSKFNLENPRSRSWVRGKLKVTTWVQHSIDSYPFQSMSICHPIPEIRLFQNLTFLKIQGQSHGWDQSWKSQMGVTSYRLTSLLFHFNRPCHSWDTAFSKFDLENPRSRSWVRGMLKVTTWVQHSIDSHPFRSMSIGPPIPEIQHFQNWTLKIQGQGHGWGGHWKSQHGSNILLTHIPLIPCQSAIPFLRYDFFKIWPWKSKVKVIGEGNVESHKVGVTSYRLTSLSFHVNQASHSWVMTFSKFDLENQGSRSWVRSQFKVTMWV